MAKVMGFRGLIYTYYANEAEFAAELGWSRQRLNKISNGQRDPDLNDIALFAEKLNLSVGEMAQIFLNQKSPNGQQ